jgi:hypothetical protein
MYKDKFKKKKIQEYYKNKYKNNLLILNYEEKRKDDPIYRIIDNLASRANAYLKNKNIERNLTHMQLIGCDAITLKEHFQLTFKDNMNFSNYGEWEIDHIKPISLYNLNEPEQLKECFNYKNLQPLWKKDNRAKYNKYEMSETKIN